MLAEFRALDRRVWYLAGARLVVTAGFSMVLPFLSMHLAGERQIPAVIIGLIFTIAGVGGATMQWVAGELADRVGRRPVMVASMVVRAANMFGLVYATAAAGLVGAFVGARLFEHPAKEMRPFGFYGGMFGIWAAAAASPLLGVPSADAERLLAGYCAAAPLLQGIGRVRCLMQGCCHGAPASPEVGIGYRLPLSRVTKAGLDAIISLFFNTRTQAGEGVPYTCSPDGGCSPR